MSQQLRLVVDNVNSTGGATLSACGRYRYHLWRTSPGDQTWARRVLFVMLNPSTADASADDTTIRKCRGFAERWGFGRFDVANLFAWRSTDPKNLKLAQHAGQDIIGPENAEHLQKLAGRASRVVVAWGAHAARWEPYSLVVTQQLFAARRGPLHHLGLTSAGLPKHPLMLAYNTPLTEFGGSLGRR